MKVNIKYFSKAISPIVFNSKSDWVDLRSAETITLKKGDFALIPLGVGMKLPKGYEAHIAPRSSTFKIWGILQTNSVAVIDNSYCGEEDEWKYPVYATRDVTIHRNDRICQFRIMKKQPKFKFKFVSHLGKISRGGFGSTGSN
jgi:dUTP pyrophosphatase